MACIGGVCSAGQTNNKPGFFKGASGGLQQVDRFTPEITNLLKQLGPMGLQQIQQGMSAVNPEAIEQRARQQFEETTLPGLYERFTSLGKGAETSGAFQGIQARGAADLEGNLAALRAQLGMQQQGLGQNLLGMGLQPTFENIYRPREASGVESLLPTAIGAGGRALGAYLSSGTSEIIPLIKNLLSSFGK